MALGFWCAGEKEPRESIFMKEELDDGDWGHPEPFPPAALVEPASTTSAHGPDPSTSTSSGSFEQPLQPMPAEPEEAPAAVEGEVTSAREAPRHIQHHHPP